MPKKLYLAHF